MTPVQQLINAIQSAQPDFLRQVIATQQRMSVIDFSTVEPGSRHRYSGNPVNARLCPRLGITPLHLAAKAYAVERDPAYAYVFNAMVADLLAAGANPWLEMGGTIRTGRDELEGLGLGKGMTVAQVCEGRLPPALSAWFAEHCDDDRTTKHDAQLTQRHPSSLSLEEIRIEKHRKSKQRLAQQREVFVDEAQHVLCA